MVMASPWTTFARGWQRPQAAISAYPSHAKRAGQSHMREQDRNLAAFGLGPFRQRFVFVHPYAIALAKRGRVAERSEAGWGMKFARTALGRNPTRPASLRSAGHPPLAGRDDAVTPESRWRP